MIILSSITVKGRIYFGFALVLCFLAIVAGGSISEAVKLDSTVGTYAEVVNNTVLIQTIDRNVAAMRRNILGYTTSGEEPFVVQVKESQEVLAKDIELAISGAANLETTKNLEEMKAILGAYAAAFDKAVLLRRANDKSIREVLMPTGESMYLAISDLMDGAETGKEWETAALVGDTIETILLMRFDSVRFRSDPSAKLQIS